MVLSIRKAALASAAGHLGNGLAQTAEHVIEREQGAPPGLDDDRLSISVRTEFFGLLGPIGR